MGIKVKVAAYNEIPARYAGVSGSIPAQTVATVVVGAQFDVDSDIILGRDGYGVSIKRKGSVNGQTVLCVSVNTYSSDQAARRLTIDAVVERLGRFLNNPAQAFEMSQENPFPKSQQMLG